MKKTFLFALAALCAFAAQAVTVKWNGTQMGGYTYGNGSANTSCSIVMVQNWTTDPGMSTFLQIIDHGGTGTKYDFRTNDGNLFISQNSENTALDGSVKIQTNTDYVLAINITANGDSDYTYDFYVNGEKIYTTIFENINQIRFWGASSKETYLYNGTLTDDEIAGLATAGTANVANIPQEPVTPPAPPSVPEPTALALLALGVAGLALKRKVA